MGNCKRPHCRLGSCQYRINRFWNSIICHRSGRNWITREQAAQITLKILKFFINSVQSTDKNGTGYKGFYYHFLRMNSGTREWNCELSSIDTGILMMGIIFARNYYNLDNEVKTRSGQWQHTA